jgi:CheY-like chemotaxis protein
MGLALTKKLCELMDGDIHIKNTSSHGTTIEFHVLLKTEEKKDKKTGSKKVKKILLVEDNIINQKLTRNLLINNGYEVDVAENGEVAIGKFVQRVYDLILMDIQMPVMDGITASKKIRMMEFDNVAGTKVKIFALTANAQKQDKDECLAAGMDGYISKPLNPKEIPLIFDYV